MSNVTLTGSQQSIEAALEILRSALPTGRRIVRVTSDSSELLVSRPLESGYRTLGQISFKPSRSYTEGHIDISMTGVGIQIQTSPVNHEGKKHYAHIDLRGDFLHITQPYYFFADRSRVDIQKHVLFLLPKKASG